MKINMIMNIVLQKSSIHAQNVMQSQVKDPDTFSAACRIVKGLHFKPNRDLFQMYLSPFGTEARLKPNRVRVKLRLKHESPR